MANPTSKVIKLKDLIANTENFRFESVENEAEAIERMVEDQKDKLFNLAKHIIENGLNPNDRPQVVIYHHNNSKYNVLEGNRRTICLKLLHNPELIKNNSNLKKKFRKLHDDYKSKLITELECVVYSNPEDANKWIKLKHTGQNEGIGTVDWTSLQIQRFDEKVDGKSSTALQVINILKNSTSLEKETKDNLNKISPTNLDRLISDPNVKNLLGIEIKEGVIQSKVEPKEVVKGLTQIVEDLLNPNFNVNNIYTKEDREDYVKKFNKSKKPDLSKETKIWKFTEQVTDKKTQSKRKPNSLYRNKLIPKSPPIKINSPKVNSIYYELQGLDVNKFTNAVAVLFRVFIELSVDCYREHHKLTVKDNDKLVNKVSQVIEDLEKKDLVKKSVSKGFKTAVSNKDNILGINTWHAYVHNNKFSPVPKDIIITWDNLHDFMSILWNNIK